MNELYHSLWKEIPKFHQHSMDQQFSNHATQSSRNSAEMDSQERSGLKFPFVSQAISPLICEFWRLHLQKTFYVLSLYTINVCYDNLAFSIWIYIHKYSLTNYRLIREDRWTYFGLKLLLLITEPAFDLSWLQKFGTPIRGKNGSLWF